MDISIIEIKNKEQLSAIEAEEVRAYFWCGSGNNGPVNTCTLVTSEGIFYRVDFDNAADLAEELKKHLPADMEGRYMGLGNWLQIRSEDSAWFDEEIDKLQDTSPAHPHLTIYRNWKEIYNQKGKDYR